MTPPLTFTISRHTRPRDRVEHEADREERQVLLQQFENLLEKDSRLLSLHSNRVLGSGSGPSRDHYAQPPESTSCCSRRLRAAYLCSICTLLLVLAVLLALHIHRSTDSEAPSVYDYEGGSGTSV